MNSIVANGAGEVPSVCFHLADRISQAVDTVAKIKPGKGIKNEPRSVYKNSKVDAENRCKRKASFFSYKNGVLWNLCFFLNWRCFRRVACDI